MIRSEEISREKSQAATSASPRSSGDPPRLQRRPAPRRRAPVEEAGAIDLAVVVRGRTGRWQIARERGHEQRASPSAPIARNSVWTDTVRDEGSRGQTWQRLLHEPHFARPGIEGRGDEVPRPAPASGAPVADTGHPPRPIRQPEPQRAILDQQRESRGARRRPLRDQPLHPLARCRRQDPGLDREATA